MTGFMLAANILGLVGNIMTSIPCKIYLQFLFLALTNYGMWVLVAITAPFVIYIVKIYETILLRTEKEKIMK
jgi:hypothetical protein